MSGQSEIVALGVDVGGTNVRLCAVDAAPRLVGEVAKTGWRAPGEDPFASLVAAVERLCAEVTGGTVAALEVPVGVGVAAQLDAGGRVVVNAPNIGWRDEPLAARLEEALGLPEGRVVLANDVNAILQGEIAFGAARGSSTTLAVFWGTGIGGAVALDGTVRTGAGGNMGEIGHAKVPGSTALCGCGETGCLEATAGGAALLRRIDAAIAAGDAAHLGAAGAVHPGLVDAAAEEGDAWALGFVRDLASTVGVALANACTLLNPDRLVLGGGVLEGCPGLRRRLEAEVLAATLAVCRRDLELVDGTLGEAAGVLGAAAYGRTNHA